jgi:hypothetical protein
MSRDNVGGRPPYVPTIEERPCVQVLAANGASEKVIARLLRINRTTLRKAFREELKEAREVLIVALGQVVVNSALNGDWRAAISWLSRFGGPEWRKTERRIISGAEGVEPARGRVLIVPSPTAAPYELQAAAAAVAGVIIEDDEACEAKELVEDDAG